MPKPFQFDSEEPQLPSFRLGFSPASGNDSVTQCLIFKAIMRDLIGRDPDGAYMRTIVEGRKRGLDVEYDPEVPGALEWAQKARDQAEWCWNCVVNGRQRVEKRGRVE